jgi:hypothetical protein
MHERQRFVISSEARELAFPATYEERFLAYRLEMTAATQCLHRRGKRAGPDLIRGRGLNRLNVLNVLNQSTKASS